MPAGGRAGGTVRGCGASGRMALRGLAAPLGEEPSPVSVPGVLWSSSRGGTGLGPLDWQPALPAAGLSWLCGPGLQGRDPAGETPPGLPGAARPAKARSSPSCRPGRTGRGAGLWGQLGERRGSGQASWPYPPVSCPHPAAQAPLPRGICHLLERKERKSKGSSLCRHLETQLDFLRTVGRGDSG